MDTFVLGMLNGISFGFILFLLASGLSLIMGVMGILNLAHGALFMIGAFAGWSIATDLGLYYWLAVVIGGLSAGLVGLVIERGLFRFLHNQLNEQVLVSFGLVFILTNATQWAWGPISRAQYTADFLSGAVHFGGYSYPATRFAIIAIGLVLAVGLWWLQDRTRVGAVVRAGMDNREMAMGLGINLERISIAVFFLGSFIAGFAGVVGAQVLGASSAQSVDVLLLSLVVVVVGGVGSIQGALLGGILIGIVDAFGKTLFPEFSMFTIFLAMVLILLARPSGLLGRRV